MFTHTSRHLVRRLLALAVVPLVALAFAAPQQQQGNPAGPITPQPVTELSQSMTWTVSYVPANRQGGGNTAVIAWVASKPPNGLVADLHCYDGETVTPFVKFVEFVPGSTSGFFEWPNLDPGSIYTANLTGTFPDGSVAEANPLYF